LLVQSNVEPKLFIYLFTYLFLGVIYASANKSQALFTKSFHEPRNKIVFCNLS